MKVVLFCGGLGTRLREHSTTIPKPLVSIGVRPIIWHLMKYYAHFGHTEFILCLGYRGDLIKEYFLNYQEAISNDFTLSKGGKEITLHNSDIKDWKITFVDTGMHSNIGQRLMAVRKYVAEDEMFLANYADGLSDLPINLMIEEFCKQDATASFAAVRPVQSFHAARFDKDGFVRSLGVIDETDFWINGGFFVLRNEIFEEIREGEELVVEPFARLIAKRRLMAYQYSGFWRAMDTFKDKIDIDRAYAQGNAPWEIWRT